MDRRAARVLLGLLAAIAPALVLERLAAQSTSLASIHVDYPEEGSVFPPEILPPRIMWRDLAAAATAWEITIVFGDGSQIHKRSAGEHLAIGETDPRAVSSTNAPPTLTPQQAAAHTWKPDTETWATIQERTATQPAKIMISGVVPGNSVPVSQGQVSIQVSRDSVGAPIFYRDVPLMPSPTEKGLIKPLAAEAVPLIGWRLKNINEPGSHLLLEHLPTCANCHSFSRDGKTLGIDVDGPENDKGTYAIVPISQHVSIAKEDVLTWNSFPGKTKGLNTLGFMTQVSPDGEWAVTTLNEELFTVNFRDYHFVQTFYPTRGILGWYNRKTGKMGALPGADDPRYVQTNAVWSPDGKYLVFARAEARESYPEGRPRAAYAGDPNETPIQYDLYRIPFNDGKGGKAERIAGASQNGMSNSFPKVSPDGRWIVFVECRTGMVMRPDSQLYIVPAEGGQARRMRANTSLMNSWHSFSPNGRWMVFSSKSRTPYTQMFLTHLDEDGRDTPPILIENATAANRAVNIPEFVNIPPDGLQKIDVPAADFYRLFDEVVDLANKGQWEAAVDGWRNILKVDPENSKAHNNLGVALIQRGAVDQGIAEFRKAIELNPTFFRAHFNLALPLYDKGNHAEAIAHWRFATEIEPGFTQAYSLMGMALAHDGKLEEAIVSFRKALELDPTFAEVHDELGKVFIKERKFQEAIAQFREAIKEKPKFVEAYCDLGAALAENGDRNEAIAQWQKALELDPQNAQAAAALRAAGSAGKR